jgi:hypothetical protein
MAAFVTIPNQRGLSHDQAKIREFSLEVINNSEFQLSKMTPFEIAEHLDLNPDKTFQDVVLDKSLYPLKEIEVGESGYFIHKFENIDQGEPNKQKWVKLMR